MHRISRNMKSCKLCFLLILWNHFWYIQSYLSSVLNQMPFKELPNIWTHATSALLKHTIAFMKKKKLSHPYLQNIQNMNSRNLCYLWSSKIHETSPFQTIARRSRWRVFLELLHFIFVFISKFSVDRKRWKIVVDFLPLVLVETFWGEVESFTRCNYACPTGNGRRPIEKPARFTTNYQFCIWEVTILRSNFGIGTWGIYSDKLRCIDSIPLRSCWGPSLKISSNDEKPCSANIGESLCQWQNRLWEKGLIV